MSFGLVLGLTVLILASVISAAAQTPSAPVAAVAASADDNRYRIGPGDVLEIRVLKAPELSRDAVRVDQRGMIRMPMITDEISAACLTEAELQQKIATLYLEYKRHPIVDVFIKEYQSQPVSIVGQVNNQRPEGTQFRLHRQVRLLEVIALAGGLSEHAGQTVNVVHAGGADLCAPRSDIAANSDLGVLISYRLADTMKGLPEANPILRSGDIVVVPEGAQAYVVGNVIKPSTIPLREPTTVSRAIAMAGGTGPASKKDQVRIVRQVPGSQVKQQIFVDLSAIEKRKAEDIILIPNDIVDVPTSGTKTLLRSLVGAVAPAMAQVPARIP
jgi:polysaccharide export outer membrane protein